ncbi:hypothetical protein [Tsukamurella sp. 1534]|nr:hypothetical protein [Tsukamurella sp. 1534]
MAVKHSHSPASVAPCRATTVHFSRSLTKTLLTVAFLALALVLILVLR